jgi:hypothetical protein
VSVLRTIEGKIESLFEGVFGRAFRTHVQPVELARKLAKEMDDNRTISVSRVYVPNEYTVYLSPADREQFESYESSLLVELQDYLAEQARRERYALLTPPKVLMESDDDLDMGEFGIATRVVQPKGAPRPADEGTPAPQEQPGATMVYRPRTPQPTEAATPEELGVEREIVSLTVDGRRYPLDKRSVVLGRSRDCDIRLEDPNVSRHHAEIRQEGATYWIVDLGSTNGLEVNGRRAKRAKLEDSDRVTMGSTELVFGRSFQ